MRYALLFSSIGSKALDISFGKLYQRLQVYSAKVTAFVKRDMRPDAAPCIPRRHYCTVHTVDALAVQDAALFETLEEIRLQKLADRDVLRQTLSPPRLEHKVSRCCLRRGRLKRPDFDVAIQRVAGDDGPAVEDQGNGCLALGVDL